MKKIHSKETDDQILDARGVSDYEKGHITGSKSIFFRTLQNADGSMKSKDELRKVFEENGVKLENPITTTCTSGISACVILTALNALGKKDVALYDGSWTEYVRITFFLTSYLANWKRT